MPFKANAARRHHIPKQRYRVTNWSEYDAALGQRGSLTVWFTNDAIAAWRADTGTTRGGQAPLLGFGDQDGVDVAGGVPVSAASDGRLDPFDPPDSWGLDLAVPDHSTLSRRAETLEVPRPSPCSRGPVDLLVDSTGLSLCGPGEWLVEKHGTR